ncbi:MAG: hypothetical protein ABJB93_11890 [Gaiellales bacterium]
MTDHTGIHPAPRAQSWPLADDGPAIASGPTRRAHRAEPAARPRRTLSVRIAAAIAALAFLLGAGLAMLLGAVLGGGPGGGGPGGGQGGQPQGSTSQVGGTGTTST